VTHLPAIYAVLDYIIAHLHRSVVVVAVVVVVVVVV